MSGLASDSAVIQSWWSSENLPGDERWFEGPLPIAYRFTKQEDMHFQATGKISVPEIEVDVTRRFQFYEGFGSSLEESTVFNLMKMSQAKREEVLRRLVDPDYPGGLGFNLMRITLGSSDFTAREFYTYADMPPGKTDPTLASFSIQRDIDYHLIEVLQEALFFNPELKLIASPWSPPAWMKDNGSLINGGNFLSEYIETYARYLRMAIQAYAVLGIPIYAMTVQNEPQLATDYPSCIMTSEQQRQLVIALKAQLDAHDLKTRILLWDYNTKGVMAYLQPILNDAEAANAVYGTAFHGYTNREEVMTQVRTAYPDKAIVFTERTYWGIRGMERIASIFRNWSTTYASWVTMLDSNKAPEKWSGTPGPTMLIQDATDPDNYWLLPEYYLFQQYSKVLQAGAQRIYTSSGNAGSGVTQLAFLNPDNSVALMVLNQTNELQAFRVKEDGRQFTTSLPGRTMASYLWPAAKGLH